MKKITKLLCGILGVAFLATGCATVGNIKNNDSELIYNGNAAVMVDGYLYYGNAFTDINGDSFKNLNNYKESAKLSYLARLNTNIELAAKTNDYSPKEVSKVAEEVVGQENQFMFVLGQYVYYTTPKKEQSTNSDNKLEYQFSYSTLCRSKLNGDDRKELYKTEAKITKIEALKYNGKYYIVFLAGENLVKMELGNKVKTTTIATGVNGIAIPKTYEKNKEQSTLDWNGMIYYTTARSVEDNTDISGTVLSKISVAGGSASQVGFKQGKTISLVGRERDVVFYTIDSKTYKLDTNKVGQVDVTSENYKYYDAAISKINLVASSARELGYLFTSNSNLVFKTVAGESAVLKFESDGTSISNIAFVNGRTIYLESATGLYSADISNITITNGEQKTVECTKIVTMTAMHEGLYSFDGKYIYFYAQLEKENDEDKITETDGNYYLYRTRVGGSDKYSYELLGLTQTKERHS